MTMSSPFVTFEKAKQFADAKINMAYIAIIFLFIVVYF